MAPAASGTSGESAEAGMVRVMERAAAEREAQFAEALHPGTRREARRARLASGDLMAYREEGEALFGLDAPWSPDETLPLPTPTHPRGAPASPDATRCLGCHRVGGEGGSGDFGDLAYFDSDGDDVLSARLRLPRMLAGAALLDRAAAGHPDRVPFGWSGGRPRGLRDMVRWSIDTHLGTRATEEEVDALTVFIALLPSPATEAPPYDSLVLRAAMGAALFRQIGCAQCHTESLGVEDPVLVLSGGRRLDLRRLLSTSGQPPFAINAYSDRKPHHMGAGLADTTPRDGAEPTDLFLTPPLWGLASRGPLLHDGRASTVSDAILAHGGEAQKARDAFTALGNDQGTLMLFLATLGRPPVMTWMR